MTSKLEDLDLNLLKLLDALVATKSTVETAERLGISQASVSRGIAKLREVFGDRLFIRRPHSMEPSELALQLAQVSVEMFRPLNKVLESYQNFDESQFNGKIKIAMNVIILELHGDGIFRCLREAFPVADFELVLWQENSLQEVISGDIDYLLHFEARPFPQEIYLHTLKEVQLCLVARKNHPVLSASSAWEDIHHLPIARLIIDGVYTKRSHIEKYYQHKGYEPRLSLATHSIRVLLEKLSHSDALSLGSHYVSELDSRLQSYPLPPMPQEMQSSKICGGYLQTKRGYPLNQILHRVIQGYFSDV